MAHYGRVSMVLRDYEHAPASGEFNRHPDAARDQARMWTRDPTTAGRVIAATWEFVLPDYSMHVIMWESGRIAEFTLPAPAPC